MVGAHVTPINPEWLLPSLHPPPLSTAHHRTPRKAAISIMFVTCVLTSASCGSRVTYVSRVSRVSRVFVCVLCASHSSCMSRLLCASRMCCVCVACVACVACHVCVMCVIYVACAPCLAMLPFLPRTAKPAGFGPVSDPVSDHQLRALCALSPLAGGWTARALPLLLGAQQSCGGFVVLHIRVRAGACRRGLACGCCITGARPRAMLLC